MRNKVDFTDVIAWSVVFSDYIVVAIETHKGIKIIYGDDSLDFILKYVPEIFAKESIYCKSCGILLNPSNIGQLTVLPGGHVEAKCISCLEREIIRTIRLMKKRPILSAIPVSRDLGVQT
ncbi:MAG TPA: hypothetical protein ENK81_02460 [Euryarchaeota archaeon]|nr:hypothetical protein [Euryarchaeota archaeon]